MKLPPPAKYPSKYQKNQPVQTKESFKLKKLEIQKITHELEWLAGKSLGLIATAVVSIVINLFPKEKKAQTNPLISSLKLINFSFQPFIKVKQKQNHSLYFYSSELILHILTKFPSMKKILIWEITALILTPGYLSSLGLLINNVIWNICFPTFPCLVKVLKQPLDLCWMPSQATHFRFASQIMRTQLPSPTDKHFERLQMQKYSFRPLSLPRHVQLRLIKCLQKVTQWRQYPSV